MRAIAVAAAVLFTAVEARADDDTIQLDTEPRVVVAAPPAFAPPASLDEYRLRLKERKNALWASREAGDAVAEQRVRHDLDELSEWYRSNTHKASSGMFAGGAVMVGVGGGALVVGAFVVAIGFASTCFICTGQNNDHTAVTAGGILMLAGGIVAVAGIPLLIIGSRRVIGPPETSLFIGPTSGIRVTF
jgi:hypothetical protein